MSVDFTPKQNTYKSIGEFRYWCQKVLPIMYDDNLTNYELLCKIMQYLNDAISNTNLIGEDMDKMYEAYTAFIEFINTYFENLDVQDEINYKIDELVTSGLFDNIIFKYISEEVLNGMSNDITNLQKTKPLGGVLRKVNDNWCIFSDANHTPINLETVVEVEPTHLKVYFTENFPRVGGFSVTPDETYMKMGINAGASVGTDNALIYLTYTRPAYCYITITEGSITISENYSQGVDSVTWETVVNGDKVFILTLNDLYCASDNASCIAYANYFLGGYNVHPSFLDSKHIYLYLCNENGERVTDISTMRGSINITVFKQPNINPTLLPNSDSANFWIMGEMYTV